LLPQLLSTAKLMKRQRLGGQLPLPGLPNYVYFFSLAPGDKSEPTQTETFSLCYWAQEGLRGAPANSSGRKQKGKQPHNAVGSQLSGSCESLVPKTHRHQKLPSWLWEGELTLAWHPGKCNRVASRERWVWKLFVCLCTLAWIKSQFGWLCPAFPLPENCGDATPDWACNLGFWGVISSGLAPASYWGV